MSDAATSKPLGDFISLSKGKPPSETDYSGEDSSVYLTPEYLRNRSAPDQIKAAKYAVFVNNGETIILWDGSNAGEVFRAKQGALASTMAVVDHNNTFNSDYFFYSLKGWESYLKGQTSGSGIPHVDREILEALKIFNCSDQEQSKIAEVLSTVDRAIEQTEALIAKQQRIKTGLMQDLLTRGIDKHGNLRSEATHAFKDSPLGRIPLEWEVKEIKDFSRVKGGKRLPAGHEYSEHWTGFKYLRVVDFYKRAIDYEKLQHLHPDTFKVLKRYETEEGDVIVSIAGSLGYFTAIAPPYQTRIILTENAAKITDIQFVNARYLGLVLNSNVVQKELEHVKGIGGGVPKLALFRIESLMVPFPTDENEQARILSKLDAVESEITAETQGLSKLRSLKTGLMQDLLTGKKRVTPLLDEEVPA